MSVTCSSRRPTSILRRDRVEVQPHPGCFEVGDGAVGEISPVRNVAREVVGDTADGEVGVGVGEDDIDLAGWVEFADPEGCADPGVASADNDDPAHRRLVPRPTDPQRGLRVDGFRRVPSRASLLVRVAKLSGCRFWFVAKELVGECGEGGAGDRREDVEPERVQVAADDCRPDRAGRVHRGTRDRAAEHRVEEDGAADGDRRGLADGTGVGGDGHDHEHQEEAEHEFPEERLGLRAGGECGADVGDVAERAAQDRRGGERAEELGGPVAERARPGEVPAEREGEGDRRVEVGAGDVPDRVDHRHDHEAEGDRDADVAELVCLGVDHDRAATGEDERERADELGHEPTREHPIRHDGLSAQFAAEAGASSGSSSAISSRTRRSSSSRIPRTVSRSCPAGSSSSQSAYFFPG